MSDSFWQTQTQDEQTEDALGRFRAVAATAPNPAADAYAAAITQAQDAGAWAQASSQPPPDDLYTAHLPALQQAQQAGDKWWAASSAPPPVVYQPPTPPPPAPPQEPPAPTPLTPGEQPGAGGDEDQAARYEAQGMQAPGTTEAIRQTKQDYAGTFLPSAQPQGPPAEEAGPARLTEGQMAAGYLTAPFRQLAAVQSLARTKDELAEVFAHPTWTGAGLGALSAAAAVPRAYGAQVEQNLNQGPLANPALAHVAGEVATTMYPMGQTNLVANPLRAGVTGAGMLGGGVIGGVTGDPNAPGGTVGNVLSGVAGGGLLAGTLGYDLPRGALGLVGRDVTSGAARGLGAALREGAGAAVPEAAEAFPAVAEGAIVPGAGIVSRGGPRVTSAAPTAEGLARGVRGEGLPPVGSNYTRPLQDFVPTVYRQAPLDEALDLLPNTTSLGSTPALGRFVASTPDLALGQGVSAGGPLLEFSTAGLQGQVSRAKPFWQALYDQGQAEFTLGHVESPSLRDSLASVTVPPQVGGSPGQRTLFRRLLGQLEQQGWSREVHADGSSTFRRPEGAVAGEGVAAAPEGAIIPGAGSIRRGSLPGGRLTDAEKAQRALESAANDQLFDVHAALARIKGVAPDLLESSYELQGRGQRGLTRLADLAQQEPEVAQAMRDAGVSGGGVIAPTAPGGPPAPATGTGINAAPAFQGLTRGAGGVAGGLAGHALDVRSPEYHKYGDETLPDGSPNPDYNPVLANRLLIGGAMVGSLAAPALGRTVGRFGGRAVGETGGLRLPGAGVIADERGRLLSSPDLPGLDVQLTAEGVARRERAIQQAVAEGTPREAAADQVDRYTALLAQEGKLPRALGQDVSEMAPRVRAPTQPVAGGAGAAAAQEAEDEALLGAISVPRRGAAGQVPPLETHGVLPAPEVTAPDQMASGPPRVAPGGRVPRDTITPEAAHQLANQELAAGLPDRAARLQAFDAAWTKAAGDPVAEHQLLNSLRERRVWQQPAKALASYLTTNMLARPRSLWVTFLHGGMTALNPSWQEALQGHYGQAAAGLVDGITALGAAGNNALASLRTGLGPTQAAAALEQVARDGNLGALAQERGVTGRLANAVHEFWHTAAEHEAMALAERGPAAARGPAAVAERAKRYVGFSMRGEDPGKLPGGLDRIYNLGLKQIGEWRAQTGEGTTPGEQAVGLVANVIAPITYWPAWAQKQGVRLALAPATSLVGGVRAAAEGDVPAAMRSAGVLALSSGLLAGIGKEATDGNITGSGPNRATPEGARLYGEMMAATDANGDPLWRPDSVRLPDPTRPGHHQWRNYDSAFGAFATPVNMTANAVEQYRLNRYKGQPGVLAPESLVAIGQHMARGLADASIFRGPVEAYQAIREEGLTKYAKQEGGSAGMRLLPGGGSLDELAKALDPREKDPQHPWEVLTEHIPVLRATVPNRVIRGQVLQNAESIESRLLPGAAAEGTAPPGSRPTPLPKGSAPYTGQPYRLGEGAPRVNTPSRVPGGGGGSSSRPTLPTLPRLPSLPRLP